MARIKIDLPSNHIFKHNIEVPIAYINYGGHLGNDSVLTICHETRIQFLKSINHSELSFFGKGIIQTDAAIEYISEAFHGDRLEITLSVGDFNPYGFDFYYHIVNADSGKCVAKAKTGIVFFDYDKRKIARCPEVAIDLFKNQST